MNNNFDVGISQNLCNILLLPYISVEYKNDDCRIYYECTGVDYPTENENKLRIKKWGFYFCVIEVLSYGEIQYCPQSELRVLFYGTARYDGVNKIYLGDKEVNDEEGVGDPNIGLLIKVLEELKKMEKQYCESTCYD